MDIAVWLTSSQGANDLAEAFLPTGDVFLDLIHGTRDSPLKSRYLEAASADPDHSMAAA